MMGERGSDKTRQEEKGGVLQRTKGLPWWHGQAWAKKESKGMEKGKVWNGEDRLGRGWRMEDPINCAGGRETEEGMS